MATKTKIRITLLVVGDSQPWPYDGKIFLNGETMEAERHEEKVKRTRDGEENDVHLMNATLIL